MRATQTVRTAGIGAMLTALVAVGGCQFDGVQSVTLPGGVGTGSDATHITVELPEVGTLTTNSQVKVDDLVVGTVTDLRVVDWHAEAELSIKPGTDLPSDVDAAVGVNSLLGSAYVELSPAPGADPSSTLAEGAVVPLDQGKAYPSTEQVLSAASVVLNGGGLEQISTITTELNRALGGHNGAIRDLLPRIESFVRSINQQQGDIKRTIRSLDATATRYSRSRTTIARAIDQLGPALTVLAQRRPDLTKALTSLRDLGRVVVPLVSGVKADLVRDLQDVTPTLDALTAAGPSLAKGLGFLVTFPFSPDVVTKACAADYCNLFLTLDLTNKAIVDGFVTPDGGLNIPGLPFIPDLSDIPIIGGLLSSAAGSVLGGLLGGSSEGSTSGGKTGGKNGGKNGSSSTPDDGGSGGLLGGLLGGVLGKTGAGSTDAKAGAR